MRTAVDNLYLFDPEFEPGARGFLNAVGGSSARQAIACMDDLRSAFTSYGLVKTLIFDTHGSPGTMWLAKGTAVMGGAFGALATATFLQSGARVLFLGCNIGEGAKGDHFMAEAGRSLLRGKAGVIGAATSKTTVVQLGSLVASETYLDPFDSGRLKVKRYDASGREIASITVDKYGAAQ